jgi:arylsulfatase A-like enzyme
MVKVGRRIPSRARIDRLSLPRDHGLMDRLNHQVRCFERPGSPIRPGTTRRCRVENSSIGNRRTAAFNPRRTRLLSATNSANRSRHQTGSAQGMEVTRRLGPVDVLVLSAWCGLAGGLFEVGTTICVRNLIATTRGYLMSRHFVWLAPLSNLMLFAAMGLLLAAVTWLWPRRGGWLVPRFITFLAVLPVLMVTSTRLYPIAWTILAAGIASCIAQILEWNAPRIRRRLLLSFPGLLVLVLILAGWVVGGEWLRERRESGSPSPPGDPPNVLLITLDTVRANHLSVYGYERSTTPTLERLAKEGVRFDGARATAPWTVPSHASIFTARWPHDLGVNWDTPLDEKFPTLAEFLGSHGYATAGFVANTMECSYDRGLSRGFTHYEDYGLEHLLPFRTAWLVDYFLQVVSDAGVFVGRAFDIGPFRPMQDSCVARLFIRWPRKDAGSINHAFIDWLSRRRDPKRPFLAFLNYYDAHAPYVLPMGAEYRFGLVPRRPADFIFLMEDWETIDKLTLRPVLRDLARDSYDNCLAYLDQRLGELFDELQRQGVLDRTLLIVTADHGEGLGEHGLFDHGESLYVPEIRVPLLIVLPAGRRSTGIVRETVSLRDLSATILDLVGLEQGSPFPGRSLAYLWRDASRGAGSADVDGAISELPKPNPYDPNHGRSPAHRGPLTSLAEGDFAYIRNDGDGTEELFNERDDPGELHNLVQGPAMQDVLDRFRRRLGAMKANPPPRVP